MYGRGREPSRNPASHFSLFASGRFGQCAVYNQIGAGQFAEQVGGSMRRPFWRGE
jgi:hypothetical protein